MKKVVVIILLVCVAVLAVRLWPHDAEYYRHRGEERLMAEDEETPADVDGALADFNHAIRLKPGFSAAYVSRGRLKERMSDPDEALADFNRAIETDSKNADAYHRRAGLRKSRGDVEGAMADYDRAIEANPNYESAYGGRAHIWHERGNIAGILTNMARITEVSQCPVPPELLHKISPGDPKMNRRVLSRLTRQYDRAIEQDPNFHWGYYTRGVLKHLAGDLGGAVADLRRCQGIPDPKLRDYAAIYLWLVTTRMKEPAEANRTLSAYLETRVSGTPVNFELQIAKFLLDQSTEAEFSAAVGGADAQWQRSQFWFYTGMKCLLAGDKTKADDCLRRARITESRPYAVAISSQMELSFLNSEHSPPE